MSFIESITAKRRMPLRFSKRKVSRMNSGCASSQEIKRIPVVRNCSGVSGIALRMRRRRSQGFSFLKRTATAMCVEVEKSIAAKPTWSITGAISSIIAVLRPVAPQRLWLPSRTDVSIRSICAKVSSLA